jgi:hypothetical protein
LVVVNMGYAVAEFLADISWYPGLSFLRKISTPMEQVLENYNNRLTELHQAKMRMKRTQERASDVRGSVEVGGDGKNAPTADQTAASEAAGTPPDQPASVPSGASAATAAAGPAEKPVGSDSHGTLSLENFMQESQVAADTSAAHPAGSAGSAAPTGQTAYFGTMSGPQPFYAADGDEAGRGTVGAAEVEQASQPVSVQPAPATQPPEAGSVVQVAPTSPARPVPAAPMPEIPVEQWAQAAPEESLWEEDQPALIPLAEREEQLARLEYVCHWLREARQPLCPVNGVVAVMSLQTLEAGPRENVELQRAVRADLTTLQDELKLRFPASALLVGLEDDRGFEELVRRVGPQRAGSQRFGHRFDVRASATPEQLAALCGRISGVFEDWVYAIFRERGSTARPGNADLFGLLCRVRSQLQGRLWRILSGGFGSESRDGIRRTPIAFSGCYFAATGRTADRRAFVRGVFDKLVEEQDHVEWTGEALRESRRFRWVGWLGMAIVVALAAWLAYTLF